jgi:hypothetical protein
MLEIVVLHKYPSVFEIVAVLVAVIAVYFSNKK